MHAIIAVYASRRYPVNRRLLLAFSLVTLCSFVEPQQGSAGASCILNYPNETVLEWNGQTHEPNRSIKSNVVSVYVPDCTGITIREGNVTALWDGEDGAPYQKTFHAITTLTDAIFKNTQFGNRLREFRKFWEEYISARCGQCFEKRPAGARGSTNGLADILQSAFSGVLVVSPNGFELPVRGLDRQTISTFRMFSGDISHRTVDGVVYGKGMIRVAPGALVGGKSYVWEAGIEEEGKQESYSGRFKVADDVRTKATLGRLAGIRSASNDQMSLEQEAAFYFEQALPGNATIALTQWFAEQSEVK